MASVLATHFCETRVKLPTEGSGIVLVFFVSWMGIDVFSLNDELPQCASVVFVVVINFAFK